MGGKKLGSLSKQYRTREAKHRLQAHRRVANPDGFNRVVSELVRSVLATAGAGFSYDKADIENVVLSASLSFDSNSDAYLYPFNQLVEAVMARMGVR